MIQKFGFQIRAKTTSSTLNKASVPAANAVEEVQLDAAHCDKDVVTKPNIADDQTSPVCAYNEWDPLEVRVIFTLTNRFASRLTSK